MKNVLIRLTLLALALGVASPAARGFDLAALLDNGVARVMGDPASVDPVLDHHLYAHAAEDHSCMGAGCGECITCRRRMDVFGKLEYLMWWGKGSYLPPLVTTGDPTLVNRNDAGVIGFNTTEVIFGAEQGGISLQNGARGTFGIWLDPAHDVGVAARVYGVESDNDSLNRASDGNPYLARPFFDVFLGEDALLIAYDDVIDGDIVDGNVQASYSSNFFATEVYGRIMMERDHKKRVDLIAGYQFFRLDDRLRVRSFSTDRGAGIILDGTTFDIEDRFSCQNEFHGGMLGLQGRVANGRVSIDWLAKAAYGVSNQRTNINGRTIVTAPMANPQESVGGLLAQGTNIGNYARSHNVFMPEVGATLNYHHTPNLAFGVGYTYIWFSSVLTAGDQIDRQVNLTQQPGPIVGPLRPTYIPRERDYWLQGLNFSVTYDF